LLKETTLSGSFFWSAPALASSESGSPARRKLYPEVSEGRAAYRGGRPRSNRGFGDYLEFVASISPPHTRQDLVTLIHETGKIPPPVEGFTTLFF
jgi:hypothetical protein